MGDLKTENTSYPATLDTRTLIADTTDDVVAAHINGPASAIVAIETELGTNPAGSVTDVTTRLAVNIHDDGGVLRGTVFPVSPPVKPHLFWRTDLKQLYIYDSALAQYQRIDSTNVHASLASLDADDHTQYVHNTTARTITAQHTFNPGSALPPFILHANAQGQKVIGLDAETVDGKNPGSASGLATLDGSSLVVQDPANATATKTAGKICKWGTSEAFQCSVLSATEVSSSGAVSGTTITGSGAVSGTTITGSSTVQGTRLISTVADGTAPLTVTSTTEVANLKAATATLAATATSLAMSGATFGTSATSPVTFNMGNATSGDFIYIQGQATATSTDGTSYFKMSAQKSSGTATIAVNNNNSSIARLYTNSAADTAFTADVNGVIRVTGTGTLVLSISAVLGGAGSINNVQGSAFYHKKQ